MLAEDRYSKVEIIKSLSSFPLISAVVERKQSGTIFVNDITDPQVVLVMHQAAFGYLYAKAGFDAETLVNFLYEENALPTYFHLYAPPQQIIELVQKDERFGIKVRHRLQLRYQRSYIDVSEFAPAGDFKVKEITADNLVRLNSFGLELDHRFWRSQTDFTSQGFGVFLENNSQIPACICYSACVAGGMAEVDIMTGAEFRQLGLAKCAAAHFVSQSIKRKVTANWDCFEENKGSLKTARAVGFEQHAGYTFLSLYKNKI